MNLPVYVTIEEVRRVCQELKLSDWTKKTKPEVSEEEAAIILKEIDTGDMDVTLEDFRQGLEVELEHGIMFNEANVTNNHPVLTARIVLAHFKEMLDYYKRLDVAEIEGDIFKAVKAGKLEKLDRYHRKLAKAKKILADSEAGELG